MVQLPEIGGVDRELVLRVWRADDARDQARALTRSRAHLTPWMEWAGAPPPSPAEQALRFDAWEARRRAGGDVIYGMFVSDRVAGGCGLHRRLGPSGLEIGYWVHVDYLRRGIATRAASLLTDTAFGIDQITHVEIHHDAANLASEGVPRRLGFAMAGESTRPPAAPADSGVERRWRMTREDWAARRPNP